MERPEMEYFDTEYLPWEPFEGMPGQFKKILSRDPKTGSHTRLTRSQPDFYVALRQLDSVKKVLCHEDFWEEVFIISGIELDLRNGAAYGPGFYACRPPGMKHGPITSPTGSLSLEIVTYV